MRSHLSSAVLLHWTVLFAGLALVCVSEAEGGLQATLELLSLRQTGTGGRSLGVSVVLGSGSLLAATLFFWAFLAQAMEEAGAAETARLAFTVAVLMLTILLAVGVLRQAEGLLGSTALLLAAVLGSHIVIANERRGGVAPDEPGPSAAKLMAADAAHTSSLRGPPGAAPGAQPEGRS
ncbi:MAG TPA: hypothetical protein VGN97_10030 [Mesorhizobium sp.]|jgi:hypothetical protein|nr:hypothetical protein [Mesorhizobium sp.]